MATQTSNLGLTKPAYSETADIADINNNMDKVDAAVHGVQNGMAILANGNVHSAVTSGQYVYVRNHGTLAEGLYTATTNISTNATLSTSNLTPAPNNGALNTLRDDVTSLNSKLFYEISISTDFNSLTNNGIYACPYYSNGSAAHRPINSAGILMVHRVSDSAYTQTYTTYSNPVEVFTRIYTNGAWTEWNSNLTPQTIEITMLGGNTAQSYMRAYKCGGCVIMHMSCSTAEASSGWYRLGSIDTAYAPKNDAFFTLWNATTNVAILGYVDRNGYISVYAPTANQLCRGTLMWGIGG